MTGLGRMCECNVMHHENHDYDFATLLKVSESMMFLKEPKKKLLQNLLFLFLCFLFLDYRPP